MRKRSIYLSIINFYFQKILIIIINLFNSYSINDDCISNIHRNIFRKISKMHSSEAFVNYVGINSTSYSQYIYIYDRLRINKRRTKPEVLVCQYRGPRLTSRCGPHCLQAPRGVPANFPWWLFTKLTHKWYSVNTHDGRAKPEIKIRRG